MALAACGRRALVLRPAPQGAEAVSLLGDTLWSVTLPGPLAAQRVALLADARRRDRSDADLAARLLLARRTAAMGRYREAVGIYTAAVERFPPDARVLRRRGEALLALREVREAMHDLRDAAAAARNSTVREFLDGPEGAYTQAGLVHGAHLLLGIGHFVEGDYRGATASLLTSLRASISPDEVAEATLWLVFALNRAGRTREAADLVRAVPESLAVKQRRAEHRLLMSYRGSLPLAALQQEMSGSGDPELETLYLFGYAMSLATSGRTSDATDALEQVRNIGAWHTLPALAAEAELSRIRHPCPDPQGSGRPDPRWNRCAGATSARPPRR